MKNSKRSLLISFLTAITYFSSLGLYLSLDKRTQKDDPFIDLIIVGGIFLFFSLFLSSYDLITGSDEKYDKENNKTVLKEREKNKAVIKQNLLKETDVAKHLLHTHYAFENWRNTKRNLFLLVAHVFIFSNVFVYYKKLNSSQIEIIIALVFAVLAFTIHVGLLFYSLYAQYYLKEHRTVMEMIKTNKNI